MVIRRAVTEGSSYVVAVISEVAFIGDHGTMRPHVLRCGQAEDGLRAHMFDEKSINNDSVLHGQRDLQPKRRPMGKTVRVKMEVPA